MKRTKLTTEQVITLSKLCGCATPSCPWCFINKHYMHALAIGYTDLIGYVECACPNTVEELRRKGGIDEKW